MSSTHIGCVYSISKVHQVNISFADCSNESKRSQVLSLDYRKNQEIWHMQLVVDFSFWMKYIWNAKDITTLSLVMCKCFFYLCCRSSKLRYYLKWKKCEENTNKNFSKCLQFMPSCQTISKCTDLSGNKQTVKRSFIFSVRGRIDFLVFTVFCVMLVFQYRSLLNY